jgi:hypothetical protein
MRVGNGQALLVYVRTSSIPVFDSLTLSPLEMGREGFLIVNRQSQVFYG